MLSEVTKAAVLATQSRTLERGQYRLQRNSRTDGEFGDARQWSDVAQVAVRFKPVASQDVPEDLRVHAERLWKVAVPGDTDVQKGDRLVGPRSFNVVGHVVNPAGYDLVRYIYAAEVSA